MCVFFFLLSTVPWKSIVETLTRKDYESIFADFDLDYLTIVFIYRSLVYDMSITS